MKLNKKFLVSIILISIFGFNNAIAQNEDIPFHPNPYGNGCGAQQTSTASQSTSSTSSSGTSAPGNSTIYPRLFQPVLATLYDIRDKCLNTSVKGKIYIDDYYYFSNVKKDFTKFTIQAMNDVIDIMPSIYSAYNNFMDVKYTGVLVDSSLSTKLISVLNSYKPLSKDLRYNSIIDNLVLDVKKVANMTKSQVSIFMNSK